MATYENVPGQTKPVQAVALVDPTTGIAPVLQTQTSTLQTTSDLTTTVFQITTATTTALTTATASVKTRLYRMRLNTAAANKITILRGVTTLEVLNFTGAGFLTYDFATRPWYTTATNEALNVTTSTAVEVNIVIETTKVA